MKVELRKELEERYCGREWMSSFMQQLSKDIRLLLADNEALEKKVKYLSKKKGAHEENSFGASG